MIRLSASRTGSLRVAATAVAGAGLTAAVYFSVRPHSFALGEHGRVFIQVMGWVLFGAALLLVRGIPKKTAAALILIIGSAAQLAALSVPPQTSSDVYRYVWDAKVQYAGVDPYSYPPAAHQLVGLRDNFLWPANGSSCIAPGATAWHDSRETLAPGCTQINRPSVNTIYPPVAEGYFDAVHLVSPARSGVRPVQVAAALLAIATAVLLLIGLPRVGREPWQAAIWAWCPLVALESGNNAHVDVLGAALLVASLLILGRSGSRRAGIVGGVLLGMSIATKLFPALAGPAVLRRRGLAVFVAAVSTFALVYVPHVIAVGPKIVGYLPGYLQEEGYQDGGRFALLTEFTSQSHALYVAMLIIAVALLASWRFTHPDRPWEAALPVVGIFLLVSATVYPWYALLLVALIALDGRRLEWLAVTMGGYLTWWFVGLGAQWETGTREGYGIAAAAVLGGSLARLALRAWPQPLAAPSAPLAGDAGTGTPAPAATALEPAADGPALVEVILPCLDEAGALPKVLAGLPDGYHAIVVDNGSTDDSAAVAARLGATVVTEPRRGFGAACHAGLQAATADVVCFCDCDGSLDLADLPLVADPVISGDSDLVLARRRPTTGAAWPPHLRLANAMLARRIRRHTGAPIHDLGPMRACRRKDYLGLDIPDRRFGYPLQAVLAAARENWRITEIGVPYAPRIGKSKVTGTVSGTLKAVRDMRRVWRQAVG